MSEQLRKSQGQEITFDQSIEVFVNALVNVLGHELVEQGALLRDATGYLTFISRTPLTPEERLVATQKIQNMVPRYTREERVIVDQTQPGIQHVLAQLLPFKEHIKLRDGSSIAIDAVDRRIVGQDWLVQPAPGWRPPAPARIVFASLKGGVGRSTALAVLAADLASDGRKVLVVDLDLEAPGIGTILIPENEKPRFGVLDWYVERALSSSEDLDLLLDMFAPSPFNYGTGLINVAPAVGSSSDSNPENMLAKISRAYLDVPQEDQMPLSFLAQTQILIDQLAQQMSYDAILVDARAGLNETTASAVLGLGADVLLFGVNTPQTFASYRYLLAHLARFPRDEDDDWLYRLRMIHAHASPEAARQAEFRDRAYAVFSELMYRDAPLVDEDGDQLLGADGQPLAIEQFSVDDPTGPHFAWPVLWNSSFAEFDPLSKQSLLTRDFYQGTYGALLTGAKGLLGQGEESE